MKAWLSNARGSVVLLAGLLAYSLVPLLLSIVEAMLAAQGTILVATGNRAVTSFLELLYFNFVTVLTIGYGDYRPLAIGATLSVLEATWGLVVFGLVIAVAAVKLAAPPRRAIIFSRYGYYSERDQRFMVVFVNTTEMRLVNAEICAYFRHGTEFTARPASRVPYVGRSAWTFFVDAPISVDDLLSGSHRHISLRCGVTGQLGMSVASAYVKYGPGDIIVIPSRDELVEYAGFDEPDFSSGAFWQVFNYRPPRCPTLLELIQESEVAGAAQQAHRADGAR